MSQKISKILRLRDARNILKLSPDLFLEFSFFFFQIDSLSCDHLDLTLGSSQLRRRQIPGFNFLSHSTDFVLHYEGSEQILHNRVFARFMVGGNWLNVNIDA